MKKVVAILLLAIMTFTGVSAQSASHTTWTKEDSSAINALALYPDSVKREIFTACEYPAVIVNTASIQKQSSSEFADMVHSYSKSEQEDIWNLSRYPNLISKMVEGGKKSKEDLKTVLSPYPSEIHDVALKYGREDFKLLQKVDDLQVNTNKQFSQLLEAYPVEVQKTFNDLIRYPEVMSLLNEHLDFTVRVGDKFRRDPDWVIKKSDSVALAEAEAHALQLNHWKETLQDSAAQKELKEAAKEYAKDNGYKDGQTNGPVDPEQINNTTVYPYCYWFGYPVWYPYAYWYPYPYWYDWGFYFSPTGNIIVFGLPSYYFINWYFWYPVHWNIYPHLGAAYVYHFYGEDRLNTLGGLVVHNWVNANRNYLPANFTNEPVVAADALRQYGALNMKVMNPDGSVNTNARDKYFKKNAAQFPALNQNVAQSQIAEEKGTNDIRQPFTKQPVVTSQKNGTDLKQSGKTYGNYLSIQKAQSYHQSGWEQLESTFHSFSSKTFGGRVVMRR